MWMRQSEKWLWTLTNQEILDAGDAEQAEGHGKDNTASYSKQQKDQTEEINFLKKLSFSNFKNN